MKTDVKGESQPKPFWVAILYLASLLTLFIFILSVIIISNNSSSGTTPSYKYYCNECDDGISGQPYLCIFYICTQANEGQVASGLDTFCSCSCGVEHMRKEGFKYECH